MFKELSVFPPEDGHIESVLVGIGQAKVSFQTWDCRKVVLIYYNLAGITSNFGGVDIVDYQIECFNDMINKYIFYEYGDTLVAALTIKAEFVKIYEVGNNADLNSALFDVGMDYIGNQVLDT